MKALTYSLFCLGLLPHALFAAPTALEQLTATEAIFAPAVTAPAQSLNIMVPARRVDFNSRSFLKRFSASAETIKSQEYGRKCGPGVYTNCTCEPDTELARDPEVCDGPPFYQCRKRYLFCNSEGDGAEVNISYDTHRLSQVPHRPADVWHTPWEKKHFVAMWYMPAGAGSTCIKDYADNGYVSWAQGVAKEELDGPYLAFQCVYSEPQKDSAGNFISTGDNDGFIQWKYTKTAPHWVEYVYKAKMVNKNGVTAIELVKPIARCAGFFSANPSELFEKKVALPLSELSDDKVASRFCSQTMAQFDQMVKEGTLTAAPKPPSQPQPAPGPVTQPPAGYYGAETPYTRNDPQH